LLPPEFGRDVDRLLVLELRRELEAADADAPDAAGELADAVTALRLAIAATQPRGEATRLDQLRARLAADLRAKLTLADSDRELGEALDRWELSLFAEEPFRTSQVREALACLLGGDGGFWAAAMRTAVLLGDKSKDRADLLAALRDERLHRDARDTVRRALVEVLMHGSREGLAAMLDETLLGLRPRPSSVLRVA